MTNFAFLFFKVVAVVVVDEEVVEVVEVEAAVDVEVVEVDDLIVNLKVHLKVSSVRNRMRRK